MIQGIDISHWNYDTLRTFDLGSYAKDNFVIIKASEGGRYKDVYMDYYTSRIFKLTNTPLFGYYHFAKASKLGSAPDEAENFLRCISSRLDDHPMLALDVEADALKRNYIDEWSLHWLTYIEAKTGIKPLIYLQQSAVKKFKLCAEYNYGLWCAKWSLIKPKSDPFPVTAIWQYGKKGGLDADRFNGSLAAWNKYVGR